MLSSVYRPGRTGAATLATQVDGEHLEVLGEPRHRRLVAPPRLGLTGDAQQRRLRRVARDGVVHLDLAEVDELLGVGVLDVRDVRRVRAVPAAVIDHHARHSLFV